MGRESEAPSLVLTGSLALLLALQAGADVMLTLADFLLDTCLLAAPLEALKRVLQGLVFLDLDFRHCFPSLRHDRFYPGRFQGLFRKAWLLYRSFCQMSRKKTTIFEVFFKNQKCVTNPRQVRPLRKRILPD